MEGENYTTSIYAEEGKTAHKLAELALRNNRPASAYVGRILDNKGTEAVTHEMADHVQEYLDKLHEYAGGDVNPLPIDAELKVYVSEFLGIDDQFGTLDASIYVPQEFELQIHDLKYGRGVRVDAENNEQLLLYALGRYHVVSLLEEVKSLLLVIHQPRLNHLSEWRISVEQLMKFAKKVKPAAQKAYELFNTEAGSLMAGHYLTPGEKQCRFCAARPHCPALKKMAHEAIVEHFTDLAAPCAPVLPESNAELAELAKKVPLLKALCNAVDDKVESEVLAGHSVPGFKLVQGRGGTRFWTDEEAVSGALAIHELPDSAYKPAILKSPAQVEKMIGKKHEVWEVISGYIGQAQGQPQVVDDKDPRPVYTPVSGDSMFNDTIKVKDNGAQ